MNLTFKSATFRLTLSYLAIVMVISLLFSAVVYRLAAGELTTGLYHQTQRIFDEYPVFDANPTLVRRQATDLRVGEHHILLGLVYFNLLVLIAAGFAAYLLARQTLEPIERAHERQKHFTADVSHELRTPLTSLRMSAEVGLLDPAASAAELRQTLESNLEDVAQMERLINSLLQLSKLDTGHGQLAMEPLESRRLIAAARKQLAATAAAKQITVHSDGRSQKLLGDTAALTQLVVILLDNALKYSPAGTAVTIHSGRHGNRAAITVTDQGQGIDPQALPHVFERFYRQDSARNQSANPGYGLGLSIAKLIADAHHGSITLTSRPGKGTTARLQLPLAPAAQGSKPPTDTAADKPVITTKE